MNFIIQAVSVVNDVKVLLAEYIRIHFSGLGWVISRVALYSVRKTTENHLIL